MKSSAWRASTLRSRPASSVPLRPEALRSRRRRGPRRRPWTPQAVDRDDKTGVPRRPPVPRALSCTESACSASSPPWPPLPRSSGTTGAEELSQKIEYDYGDDNNYSLTVCECAGSDLE